MNKDNKRFIVDTSFLKKTLHKDLALNEFLLLMYFDNQEDLIFDVKKISKDLCMDEKKVMEAFANLLDKNVLTLKSEKDYNNKLVDKVSLDSLYKNSKDETDLSDFYDEFQNKYGKSLSGMDFEIINTWLAAGFNKDLILKAVDEANSYGVASLKYIDKILFEWNKKGYKNPSDIKKEKREEVKYATAVMEFNWLDED